MVIDTSAVTAIFLAEAERQAFLDAIVQAESRLISAANVLETEGDRPRGPGAAKLREESLIYSWCAPDSKLFQWMPSRSRLRAPHGAGMARDAIRQDSISEIVLPTRWQRLPKSRCWRREPISRQPMLTCIELVNEFRMISLRHALHSAHPGAGVFMSYSSSFTSPRSALTCVMIFSCSCAGTMS